MNCRAAQQLIPISATLNARAVGEINAAVENDQLRGLDITPIRAQLEELLPPEEFQKLQTNSARLMPPELLESAGVRTHFDFQTLTVELTIPTEKRRTQTLSLIGNSGITAARTITPSDFSAYLNIRGGLDYIESSKVNPLGFTDPQFALENAFNWRGFVLENEIDINPAPDKTWEKRDTRLIWDQPEKRLRWTLGDLNYPVTSFQAFLPMAGLSLHREKKDLSVYALTAGKSTSKLHESHNVGTALPKLGAALQDCHGGGNSRAVTVRRRMVRGWSRRTGNRTGSATRHSRRPGGPRPSGGSRTTSRSSIRTTSRWASSARSPRPRPGWR